jgi:hypothetical protein
MIEMKSIMHGVNPGLGEFLLKKVKNVSMLMAGDSKKGGELVKNG